MSGSKYVVLSVVLLASVLTTNCRKKGNSSSSSSPDPDVIAADVLQNIANKKIELNVPESCPESESEQYCETWLGMRADGMLGLTHITNRISFAIEDLDADGRFHIAVYPDCKLDERAAEEAAAATENSAGEIDDSANNLNVVIKTGSGEPPPLLDDDEENLVTPPDDNDPNNAAFVPLEKSPLSDCRKLVVASVNQGDPVTLVDPAAADDNSWWKMHFPAEGHPVFVSATPCEGPDCRIRLLMADDGNLTAIHASGNELGLKSFWKKISGSIKKAFNSIESGVADIKKQVGTSIDVEKLGNKKLFVSAALPGSRLYSAIKEEGAKALSDADGTLKDGALYVKVGGKYVEQGGVAAIEGAKYIAEYIINNACYLSMMVHLGSMFGNLAVAYEAALSSHFIEYYNKYSGKMSYENMAKDKSSPTYLEIQAIALNYALEASAISGKFKVEAWRQLIIDIILSAFAGNIKAGYTPILASKVATAMCKGTDEALSAAHAVLGTMNTAGLPDDCLEGIKTRANERYEQNALDMCYALRDEIKSAATHEPSDNKVTTAWSESVKKCPSDINDDGYLNLLEGVGCQKKRVITDQNQDIGDVPIDDLTILTHERYWGGDHNFTGRIGCKDGMVAIGMCTSGSKKACFGKAKEILCAKRTDGPVLDNARYADIFSPPGQDITYCPKGYAVNQFCNAGFYPDCKKYYQAVRCSAVSSRFTIDYSNCDTKESKSWSGRVEATAPNHVMVGLCTSPIKANCGLDVDVTKSAVFCPLKPAADDGTTDIFRFYSKDKNDHLLTSDIGENLYSYRYEGAGFRLFSSGGEGRVALYRCLNGNDHFASTSSTCEGKTKEGMLGYMATTGDKPINRCKKDGDHMITADLNECTKDGYKLESVLGYAP